LSELGEPEGSNKGSTQTKDGLMQIAVSSVQIFSLRQESTGLLNGTEASSSHRNAVAIATLALALLVGDRKTLPVLSTC
jgi:hypothetical protein